MARKPAAPAELVRDAPLDGETIIQDQHQLSTLLAEQDTRVRAVAAQLGYQLPADSSSADLIQRDIAANMRRSVEACLEIGRGLRVLKEACVHGEFGQRLDTLGIEIHVASRFISAATKFAKLPTSANLTKALGTQSKLLEMLVLDDEQIEELELTGQTGELTLDDVATMSVKELRSALRETREDKKALAKVAADKNAKLDELAAQLARKPLVETRPKDEILEELRLEATARAGAAEAALAAGLRPAIEALIAHGNEEGIDQRRFLAGLLAQVEQVVLELRDEHGIAATPQASAMPAWMDEDSDDLVRKALDQEA
jgi:hypothetical protein